jgi:hypothetical protein
MLHTPKMWGGLEAFELQILLLIEIRLRLNHMDLNIVEVYSRFLNDLFPRTSSRPACCVVKTHEELVNCLRQFVEYLDIDH